MPREMRNRRSPAGLLSALRRYLLLPGALRVAVTGRSMEPVLQEGDHLIVSRLAPRLRGIRRGDVVFLRAGHAGSTNPECIKRVVGLPHDRVVVAGNRVVVNGKEYAPTGLPPAAQSETADQAPPARSWSLAPGECFVLGDNRAHSTDSRSTGPVALRDIIGIAVYRYAPADRRTWLNA